MTTNNSINAPFPIVVPQGGTGAATLTNHGILLGNGASAITATAELSDGQLLIGSAGNAPVAANLIGGVGIAVSNTAGGITINAEGFGFTWNPVAGASSTLAAENGYISNGAALTTYTLPTSAAVGDAFSVLSSGANTSFSKIAQNAGQKIRIGNQVTTAGISGSLTGTAIGDVLTFVCVDATVNAEVFQVTSSVGNFTVV